MIVDLGAPGVRIVATPYEDRWTTVAERARESDAAVAINGGFWGVMQRPRGIAAGGGEMWPTGAVDAEMGFFSIDDRGRARIRAPGEAIDDRELASISEAVSGRPILVRDGEIVEDVLDTFPTSNQRHPRTAVGLTEDRRTAILVVVDGRRSGSRGMTLYELSRVLAELGAHDAINLDGGGSSAMYVARAGGVVSVPSRGRWEVALREALGEEDERVVRTVRGHEEVFVRGLEIEAPNHLAVIAPDPISIAPTGFESGLVGAPPIEVVRPPPRPPRWRLGTLRETIFPVLWAAPPIAMAIVVVVAIRRRLRARRARPAGSPLAGGSR